MKLRLRLVPLVIVCTALAACSTTLEPQLAEAPLSGFDLVDPAKVNRTDYEKDYAACAALANQNVADVSRMAAGAVGAVADKATLGILGNKASKNADRATVLKRCLTGRGYQVLR